MIDDLPPLSIIEDLRWHVKESDRRFEEDARRTRYKVERIRSASLSVAGTDMVVAVALFATLPAFRPWAAEIMRGLEDRLQAADYAKVKKVVYTTIAYYGEEAGRIRVEAVRVDG